MAVPEELLTLWTGAVHCCEGASPWGAEHRLDARRLPAPVGSADSGHPGGARSSLAFHPSAGEGGDDAGRPLVEDWATDWDYNGPQYHQNAPEVWRELHQHCPVAHTDRFHGAWLVVRAADVSAIAHDTALFSSRS